MTVAPRTEPMVLRPAEEGDVEGIQRVAREAWDQVYSGFFGAAERQRVLEHAFSRRSLLEDLAHHSSYFFVAAVEGGVVGFAELVIDGRCGEVARIAVLPDWQRRGVATALLRRGFAVLAAAGATTVTAAVEPEDEACRALFESHGFETVEDPLSDLEDVGLELAEYRRTLDDAAGEEPAAPEATVWVELPETGEPEPAASRLPSSRRRPAGVPVLASADACRLAFVESALEAAGVPYTRHAAPTSDREDEPVVEIRVARARLDETRELLDALDGGTPDGAADE